MALNFATRLILSEFDKSLMIERSLESLADFGQTEHASIFLVNPLENTLVSEGSVIANVYTKRSLEVDINSSIYKKVLDTRKPEIFDLATENDTPTPAINGGKPGHKCLCIPLVASDNKSIGLATLAYPREVSVDSIISQHMVLLLTVISMGLENLRLFNLAVNDGLTSLYVRSYFDNRLKEEVTRVKRHGGKLGVLVTDIDHFKQFNDTHGHQQGDRILKEVAKILQKSVRVSLDVVCRYGGEEFVVIMPDTDVEGSLMVAERIRETCQNFQFPSNGATLNVTLSGGIACVDSDSLVSEEEIFGRADQALYQSKKNGRNQIHVWKA